MVPRCARASFHFACAPDGATYLARQFAPYPLHVTRPFRFEGDPAGMVALYLQSVSGGLYPEEGVALDLTMEADAAVHVTTQASTIVHGSRGASARQRVSLRVGERAFAEYWPEPLILFPDAALESSREIEVGAGATVLVADAFLAHDPEGGERCFDRLESVTRVASTDGRVLLLDRFTATGPAASAGLPGVSGGCRAQATVLALGRSPASGKLVEVLRGAIDRLEGIYAGASELPNGAGAWARLLAEDGVSLGRALDAAWVALRTALGYPEPRPRRK